MMSIKVPVGDSWSAMITAELSGFSVRASSTIWRIWFSSTSRLLIQMSPVWSTPIRMLPRGRASAVSASGRLGSMPVSFTKEVVTMKKISMMNTMSSIGVMLISVSSSGVECLRAMSSLRSVGQRRQRNLAGARHPGLVDHPHQDAGVRVAVGSYHHGRIRIHREAALDVGPHGADVGGPALDGDLPRVADADGDHLGELLVLRRLVGGTIQVDAELLHEGRRHDEKDQHDEYDVEHRRDVDLRLLVVPFQPSAHRLLRGPLSGGPAFPRNAGLPCRPGVRDRWPDRGRTAPPPARTSSGWWPPRRRRPSGARCRCPRTPSRRTPGSCRSRCPAGRAAAGSPSAS